MQLKAGELSFHVLESGSGEPALLFLHYWGWPARAWNAVISQLSPDFRCIAYDQRGVYGTRPQSQPFRSTPSHSSPGNPSAGGPQARKV